MRFEAIHFPKLRNEEHYQFHNEFDKLIENTLDENMLIKSHVYITYHFLLIDIGVDLDSIKRTANSDEIVIADEDRDAIFQSLNENIKTALDDFSPQKKQAATRLGMVINKNFNLAIMPFDEEALAMNNLLMDFNNYQNEIAILGLADWINELRIKNNYYNSLKRDFLIETSSKTLSRIKGMRLLIDAAYMKVIHRINIMIFVNGKYPFSYFINKLNLLIESHRELITQRQEHNFKLNEVLVDN